MSPSKGLVQSGIFADESVGNVSDTGAAIAAGTLNAEIPVETVLGILAKTVNDRVAPHSQISFAAHAGEVTVARPAGGLTEDPDVKYAETKYNGYDMFGIDPNAKPS